MYTLRSTDGVELRISGIECSTLDMVSRDVGCSREVAINIPFHSCIISLLNTNYNKLKIKQCYPLLEVAEFIGCYDLVEKVSRRLLDLARCGIMSPLTDRVKMILGVTLPFGIEAVILGMMEYEFVSSSPNVITLPIEELNSYVRSFIISQLMIEDTIKNSRSAITTLITRFKRMNIKFELIIESLYQECNNYGLQYLLLSVLIECNHCDLLRVALKNGYFYSTGVPLLASVLYGFNREMIDVVMESYHLSWNDLLSCCINSNNPYPMTMLTFNSVECSKINSLNYPLILTNNDVTDRIRYMLNIPSELLGNSELFWNVILRELLCSCHFHEASMVLTQRPECVQWLRSIPPLNIGEDYMRSMVHHPNFNVESIRLLFQHCPVILIDYRDMARTAFNNLMVVAQYDVNVNNLIILMGHATIHDKREVRIATSLFQSCYRAGTLVDNLVGTLMNLPNYYRVIIPLRLLDPLTVWRYIERSTLNQKLTTEYVKILFKNSGHQQRRIFMSTSNKKILRVINSITIPDC
jgi:hypothetical protein